ncbi:MAG: CAP domain-containing protein [Candidatus Doudnabacteria bacterium]|nr:CAP domain-containing protein [Candidatus Doudnabacteria bacterium]
MKKILTGLVLVAILVTGFEYYSRYHEKIKDFAADGYEKLSQIRPTEEKREVITPGALRSKDQSKNSYLTRVGTINQTNLQRQQLGLPALVENSELGRAALAKAKDMFEGQYFEHISPIGKGPGDLAEEAGYFFVAVGENLALGNFKNDAVLVQAWMDSPGHRANILSSKYTEIGVAVLKGEFEGHSTWIAVQEFGRPKSSCPSVDSGLKLQIGQYKEEINSMKPKVEDLKSYLSSTEPKTQDETDVYNVKVGEYNDMVKIFNNKVDWLKELTAKYNSQVTAFNACVGE